MPLNVYLAKDNLESYVQSPHITNGYTRQLTQPQVVNPAYDDIDIVKTLSYRQCRGLESLEF